MAIQKKHGKGRLDKWYKLAKEKGYRARAAFKLIQLNKKYGFLEKSKVLIDLCAAPGSWCQVAAETMPVNSLIVGVDLAPIKAIPKCITFQSDITTDKCRATLRQHLKTWKADTVLHDGAPNVGTAWNQDSFNQAELVLQSMKLATEFLVEGGTFVTKVFRSKDYNPLLWVFNQLFTKVEATKPPSSRNVSAEIFVVCRGYKAPKRIDPRFLDPKAVFASSGQAPHEAKVYNPEIKKRKRDGYEEGDYTLYKEAPASEFIQTDDPLAILGGYNKLTWAQPKNGDVALAAMSKLPETTDEIRLCCEDLKVLGRRDFKILLKWRLKVREIFGLSTKKDDEPVPEEVAEVEDMDEELKIQEELQAMRDRESTKKKRERRRENEKKQKEIVRMQMNMMAPMDIGMEQDGPMGADSMFRLKIVDKAGAANKIAQGRMAIPREAEQKDSGIGSSGETDDETDEEEDRLEEELDGMYQQYKEKKAEADAKYRAKRRGARSTMTSLRASPATTRRETEGRPAPAGDDEADWSADQKKADGTLDIDIITAEAMTLAHQLATGQKTSHDLVDDGFNRHAFRDRDGLPEWFMDDEGRHDKPHKPITKAAADAIKEKMRAYNARPIKKVAEAKARKKFKAAQRYEKLKKKTDSLVNEEGLTEKEKASTIAKMIAKAGQVKRRPQPTLVIAKGLNRGVKGRPKGVKGRYTIVDARMKKDLRAQKRLSKKKKR
ncbi:AdoMet-dependent rRNA methyltransferase SPB1 [Verticillium alfalfae VaMs.102]|uniref:AdoMet-dependent rRNA methyltransferase SPB1 n=1 Tax=Verticillium alfalfae (strain VaMs.102 / ATCC MYA-4576 / FGSC 10136) TaxID=526221 RepID=C9SG83_VERA1|nr:AdoMet-dependent rRNA methyltransferase SPB1 [Verticillium alfalfae VaMs.102]EEY18097.1 AdoMet-dependent rRNA methyltransferase SPB1 [Verticillium alfalfae VaMs.102]